MCFFESINYISFLLLCPSMQSLGKYPHLKVSNTAVAEEESEATIFHT